MNPKLSLRIVLVLSFIGSGSSFLAYFSTAVFYPQMQQMLEAMASTNNEMAVAFDTLLQMPRLLFLALGAFYGISLLGAISMWHLRPSGFHFYTLSQMVILVLPVVFMGKAYFAIGDAMMTVLFVTYYFFTLRRLGVFNASGGNDTDSANSDSSFDTQE